MYLSQIHSLLYVEWFLCEVDTPPLTPPLKREGNWGGEASPKPSPLYGGRAFLPIEGELEGAFVSSSAGEI